MMAEILLQGLNLLLVLATLASIVGWVLLLRRRFTTGQPLVRPRGRREPFWTLIEFFVCYGLLMVCTTAAALTARRLVAQQTSTDVAALGETIQLTSQGVTIGALATSITSLLVLVSLLAWMGLTQRTVFARYGLWPHWSDLRLGLIASLFILPPVLQLATLLDRWVPYKHSVLDAVKEHPTLGVFLAMTFSAAIMAPLFEEFMFRALLQGGAERFTRRVTLMRQAFEAQPELTEAPKISERISSREVRHWPWGPVMISSATFALMHLGQGAAPIALFVLAVALGYLYRQTGRLWPCIIVHFVLNAFSMIGLALQVAAGRS